MIPSQWLRFRLETLDPDVLAQQEMERLELPPEVAARMLEKSRERWHKQWLAFLARRVLEDEVWYFESPAETWKNDFAGAAGYALLRAGQVVEQLTIRRS